MIVMMIIPFLGLAISKIPMESADHRHRSLTRGTVDEDVAAAASLLKIMEQMKSFPGRSTG